MAANTHQALSVAGAALRESILWHAKARLAQPWQELSLRGKMFSVCLAIREKLAEIHASASRAEPPATKRVYLLSMEYLVGRCLENHLVNLGLVELCRQVLASMGTDLDELLDAEPDAGLGAGGVGGAGAAFLDALVEIGIAGCAYGINYQFGPFKQRIRQGLQVEAPHHWRRQGCPWQVERPEPALRIPFGGSVEAAKEPHSAYQPAWADQKTVLGVPYDMFVSAPGGHTVGVLRLFCARASDEFDRPIYDSGDYTKAIEEKAEIELFTKVLYTRDEWSSPSRFRLLQEYFLVACALRDILRAIGIEHLERLPDRAAIHLNDTQLGLAVAELMHLLVDENRLPWETAWEITTRTLTCTTHAETADMFEKWPVWLIEDYLPRHLQIIYEINQRFLREVLRVWPGDHERVRRVSLIEEGPDKQLRMAYLAAAGCHSVTSNGSPHFDLVRTELLPDLVLLLPAKFNAKTGGVNVRRWIRVANPDLGELITEALGEGWVSHPERLTELEPFSNDAAFRERFLAVKQANKRRLQRALRTPIHEDSFVDVQLKPVEESRRHLLTLLGVVHDYLRIVEDSYTPPTPKTVLFAGRAAPSDFRGKEIIQLIYAVARTIDAVPRAKQWLTIVFAADYRLSLAEKIIPAADLSEQVSTAASEPAGTCQIKLALNGAITIGAPSGVVIELVDAVGAGNIYLFGNSEDEIRLLKESGVHPREFYSRNHGVRRILDLFLTDEFSPGEPDRFAWVYHFLVENWDPFHHLADLESYLEAHGRAEADYLNQNEWAGKAILNIARNGAFCSRSAVEEYARDIWGVVGRTKVSGFA
jgi:starch phosphorylase